MRIDGRALCGDGSLCPCTGAALVILKVEESVIRRGEEEQGGDGVGEEGRERGRGGEGESRPP